MGRFTEVWIDVPDAISPNAPNGVDFAAQLYIEGSKHFDPPAAVLGVSAMQATECAFHAIRLHCTETGANFSPDQRTG
ncbi:MAG: hypothetical protein R3F61_13955 [Myxococcota bacterium]